MKFLKSVIFFVSIFISAVAFCYGKKPYYTYDDNVFWFVWITDTHVGEELLGGSNDTDRLKWVVGELKEVVEPAFIIHTGDLVDATGGGPVPIKQFKKEWKQYEGIVKDESPQFYHDLPGNHDQYSDKGLTHYLKYSVQGKAFGSPQNFWQVETLTENLLFIGTATCGEDGAAFPFDNAGLSGDELNEVESWITLTPFASQIVLFGHHPISDFNHGKEEFLNIIQSYGAIAYLFGHTHDYEKDAGGGFLNYNLASLGKSDDSHIGIVAIDGLNVKFEGFKWKDFPYVLITSPMDKTEIEGNPFVYIVPRSNTKNPVRVLVFDKAENVSVKFSVEDGEYTPMTEVKPHLFEGFFDGTKFTAGQKKITVVVTGSKEVTKKIYFDLIDRECADGIDNDGDGLTDYPFDPSCEGLNGEKEFKKNENLPPVAKIIAPEKGYVGDKILFNGKLSSDPEGEELFFEWDFEYKDPFFKVKSGDSIGEWTYSSPGEYTVALKVYDKSGNVSYALHDITIFDKTEENYESYETSDIHEPADAYQIMEVEQSDGSSDTPEDFQEEKQDVYETEEILPDEEENFDVVEILPEDGKTDSLTSKDGGSEKTESDKEVSKDDEKSEAGIYDTTGSENFDIQKGPGELTTIEIVVDNSLEAEPLEESSSSGCSYSSFNVQKGFNFVIILVIFLFLWIFIIKKFKKSYKTNERGA